MSVRTICKFGKFFMLVELQPAFDMCLEEGFYDSFLQMSSASMMWLDDVLSWQRMGKQSGFS